MRCLCPLRSLLRCFVRPWTGVDVEQIVQVLLAFQCYAQLVPVLYALQDKNSTEIRRILSKRELSDGDITKLLDLVLESKQVRKLKNKMETLAKEACTLLLAIENRGSLNIFTQMVQTLTEDL